MGLLRSRNSPPPVGQSRCAVDVAEHRAAARTAVRLRERAGDAAATRGSGLDASTRPRQRGIAVGTLEAERPRELERAPTGAAAPSVDPFGGRRALEGGGGH